MEAEEYTGPLAKPDIIAVYATKEEWADVLRELINGDYNDTGTGLIRALNDQGVHE